MREAMTTTLTRQPPSLCWLPTRVWRSALTFLSGSDALRLSDTHPRIRAAWEDTLRSSVVTVPLRSTEVYGVDRGCLQVSAKRLLSEFGHLLTWVRFLTSHLALAEGSFRCLSRWALANLGVLQSLHVEVWDEFGEDFTREVKACEDSWISLWAVEVSAGTEVTVHVHMLEPSECIETHYFDPMPVFDIRYDIVTELGFSGSLPVSPRLRLPMEDPRVTPLTDFLSQFCNLTRLYLRLQEVDDTVLVQLSEDNQKLTELEIQYKSVSLEPWHVSDDSWAILTARLPALKVKCFLFHVYLSEENIADLDRVFKPSTPLQSVVGHSHYDLWEASQLVRWCEQFSTLRHVSFQILACKDDTSPEQIIEALKKLCGYSPDLKCVKFGVESRGKAVKYTCTITS